jgi:hypothetical protein
MTINLAVFYFLHDAQTNVSSYNAWLSVCLFFFTKATYIYVKRHSLVILSLKIQETFILHIYCWTVSE